MKGVQVGMGHWATMVGEIVTFGQDWCGQVCSPSRPGIWRGPGVGVKGQRPGEER